ncbi:MAG: hypothetical protein L6Q92_11445 [Phycisphaerae bacterium]|nr:hypothetical protein [Phycisphaerae bacterium]
MRANHSSFRRHGSRWVLSFVWLAGCGGATDVTVSRPASERPDVDAAVVSRGARRMPTDEALNLVTFTSGQGGDASGKSAAASNGTASASAQSGPGGSAWGAFQVGYCFDNASSKPLRAIIRLKAELAERARVSVEHADNVAKVDLSFIVSDSNGSVLRREPLATREARAGPYDWAGTHEMAFEEMLEPGIGYYLFASGRVDAQVGKDSSGQASASVELKRCELTIEWQPAAATTRTARADRGLP